MEHLRRFRKFIPWPTQEERALDEKRWSAAEAIRDHARELLGPNVRFSPLHSAPGPVETEDGLQVGAVTRDGRALMVNFEEIGRME